LPAAVPAESLDLTLQLSGETMSRNQDLQQRRDAAFARGLGNQLPVYIERARNAEMWAADG
jgi:4-aminobutyrate aminotransferase-like enzyme